MPWPWSKKAPERKSVNFLTGDGATVVGGLPPFGPSLILNGSEEAARSSSGVMSIVNWAQTNGSEPPLVAQQETENGWERIAGPAADIVRRPDPENAKVTQTELKKVAFESLILCGEAYFLKLRGQGSGRVMGLLPVRALYARPRVEQGRLVGYDLRLSHGQTMVVPPEDVIHVKDGVDPENPHRGRSRLREAAMSVATDREVSAFMYGLVKSPFASAVISPKGDVEGFGEAQAIALKDGYTQMASGARAGSVVVPSIPVDVTTVGYSPDKMALDRIKSHVDANLSAIFGLPAIVAGMQVGLDRSTFSNMKEAREAAVEQFLIPMWNLIAEAFTVQLGSDFWGDDERYRYAFDYSEVRALQDDVDALWERHTKAFIAGTIDRATWKARLGFEVMPEDEGIYSYMLKGTDMQTLMAGVVAGKRSNVPG